jgi:hypothetical protein
LIGSLGALGGSIIVSLGVSAVQLSYWILIGG